MSADRVKAADQLASVTQASLDLLARHMHDGIREAMHAGLHDATPAAFLAAYCARHEEVCGEAFDWQSILAEPGRPVEERTLECARCGDHVVLRHDELVQEELGTLLDEDGGYHCAPCWDLVWGARS